MSSAEEEFRKKKTRIRKTYFWLIAIPIGVLICMLTAPIIPITGCAVGWTINKIYKDLFH